MRNLVSLALWVAIILTAALAITWGIHGVSRGKSVDRCGEMGQALGIRTEFIDVRFGDYWCQVTTDQGSYKLYL